MKLETRILYYLDLQTLGFKESLEFQERIRNSENSPETIFSVTHPDEISFGNEKDKNLFDPIFLKEIGEDIHSPSEENVARWLNKNNINFSKNGLGGGATAFGEGQIAFYSVIHTNNHFEAPYEGIPVGNFRKLYNQLMINTAQFFMPNHIDQTNIGKYKLEVDDKADVFVKGEDYMIKIASKGMRFTKTNGKQFCLGGFVYFVNEGSVDLFKYVLPCGLNKNTTHLSSWEELLNYPINLNDVKSKTLEEMKLIFGFSEIIPISYGEYTKQFLE